MRRFLRKLLNLQPGEGRTLAALYALGFVIATGLVWGSAIGRGLFLKHVGIEWLPLMFIFDGLLALPVTILYTAVVDRVNNARLMAAIFGGVGLVLIVGWGLLLLDSQGVVIPYVTLVYALFYLAERVLRALVAVHAWTFFNDYLDIRSAKRIFPILGSASRVAGIAAGPLVAVMAGILSAQNLVLAWVLVLAVGVWLALRIPHWLTADRAAKPSAAKSRPDRSPLAAYWENLRGGLRFVVESPFLRVLALGAFAMTALLALMDYQAQHVFDNAYATAEGLIGFYGLLETVINLIALPVQMFLISRLVSWLGVARVNLIFPFGSLLIYAALSFWPSLPTAMAGQFGKDTFRSSVQVPVDNMLYNAVPPAVKGRARAFIKAILLPLATVGVGLLLMPVRRAGALPTWIIGVGLAAALLQLWAAFLARRRYTQALVTMLAEEDFNAYRLTASDLGPPDPATFQRLLDRLRAAEDEDMAVFLTQIVAEVGGREACAPLIAVAEGAAPSLRAAILETLLETDSVDGSALDLSIRSLEAEEPRLRRAALAVLERWLGRDDPHLWRLAAPLLDDADPETRRRAILLLIRCGDFFYMAEAIRALHELLADAERPQARIAGLRLLQALGDARMVRNVIRYLDDADDGVRLQAARTIEALADPDAPAWTAPLIRQAVAYELQDPVEAVRLCALRTLGRIPWEGEEAQQAMERLLAALADPAEPVRQQAGQGLAAAGAVAAPRLAEVLADEQAPERQRLAAAITLGEMVREGVLRATDAPRYTRQIEALFEDTLRRIYGDVRLIAALGELKPPAAPPSALDGLPAGRRRRGSPTDEGQAGPALALLRDGLRRRNEDRLRGAFRLLEATLPRAATGSLAVIANALWTASPKSAARSNALEALESLTSARRARLVGRLTPPGREDLDALLRTAQEEWDLSPLDAPAALRTVLKDPDRWLAAIAVFLLGQGDYLPAEEILDIWLPEWEADPDPAVRQAAQAVRRRLTLNQEVKMVDTTEMPVVSALSAVERAIFLKQVPFFAGMTVDQLRILAGIAEEQDFEEGDVIFAEGSPGEALYVIVGGRVGIEREPKEGRVQRLETLGRRQYFGERTIFDGAPHENRAVALDHVHLLVIRREPLLALIRRSPDISLSLVEVLSKRLREADSKLAARTRAKPDKVMRLYDRLTAG